MDDVEWRVPKRVKKRWYLNIDARERDRGSFGQVFRGTLEKIPYIKVAVKKQKVDSHEHEVSILRGLDHTNIVPLLGSYVEKGMGYLVVPMYESNLSDWEGECYDLLADELTGLDYLKSQRVVHCDIKPENICVRNSEEMGPEGVIIDFGLAKYDGEKNEGNTPYYYIKYLKKQGLQMGTLGYLKYDYNLSHDYDVFCLGILSEEIQAPDREECEGFGKSLLMEVPVFRQGRPSLRL